MVRLECGRCGNWIENDESVSTLIKNTTLVIAGERERYDLCEECTKEITKLFYSPRKYKIVESA